MKINLEREGKAGNKKYSCIQFLFLRKAQRSKTLNHGRGTEAAEERITKNQRKKGPVPRFLLGLWLIYLLTMKR